MAITGLDDDLSGSVAIFKAVSEQSCLGLFRYARVGLIIAQVVKKALDEPAEQATVGSEQPHVSPEEAAGDGFTLYLTRKQRRSQQPQQ